MQNSIHSREEIKTIWKKFGKMLLVVHLSFLHAKQLTMKLFNESLQVYANLLLGLMPANYIPTRCFNPCLMVFIGVGIPFQKREDSYLVKTRPTELDALRRHYIQEKSFKVIEMWECECWRLYITTNTAKQHVLEHSPYRRSLAAEQLLQ